MTSVPSPAALATRFAAAAVALGGLAMVVLWVPFTLAHGPTSYNEERVVAGMDMLGWGLLLGVVPNVLVATGLVLARGRLARSGGTAWALGWVIAALVLSALADLAFRALGPPFSLFVLAPATIALVVLAAPGGVRVAWAVLAAAYVVALALALVPHEAADGFDGYRVYGLVAHVTVGLGWVVAASRIGNFTP